MSNNNFAAILEKSHDIALWDSSQGYLNFLDHIIVDSQPKKKPFRTIAESWQWERSIRSAPALDSLAGLRDDYTGPKSFWNGYHKGSDKTHDNAREICWLLGWSKRKLSIYVCAGSEDQAGLITAAMRGTVNDNPWMKDYVHVTDLTARGASGSELSILSMNAYTAQGVFPDYIVASEITHWMYDEGRKFWDFILSSVNKRPSCILKVETNAGHIGSWQWAERNRIAKSKFWSFYEAPMGTPLPTWMNQAKIDDDSQGMSPGERDRLYKNRWVDPGEEHGYLTMEECVKCIDYNLTEQTHGSRYQEYFLVVDYGGVKDRCSLAVMHTIPVIFPPREGLNEREEVHLHAIVDRLDCWQGTHENRIDINIPEKEDGSLDYTARSVEGWIDLVRRNFRIGAIVIDPHQLEALAIKYERKGVRVERFKWRRGQNNHRMAQLLKTCVQNRQVTWSKDAGYLPGVEDDTLCKELSRLVIKDMVYGYKFDHTSGRHDDRSCVIAMGLLYSMPVARPDDAKSLMVVQNNTPIPTIGSEKSIVTLAGGNDYAAMNNVYGVSKGQTGSAWDRGDIS